MSINEPSTLSRRLRQEDKITLEELREIARGLKHRSATASPKWRKRETELRRAILTQYPSDLLNWKWTRITMHPGPVVFERSLLEHEWETKWQAIVESAEKPERGAVTRHCGLLAWFQETTGFQISDFKSILEFGGGYGGMRRVVYRLAPQVDYAIYDLPMVAALQQFWLASQGLKAESFIDLPSLRAYLGDTSDSLFIATWSLNESPKELREEFFELTKGFKAHLIAYGPHFGDERKYFMAWSERLPQFRWTSLPVDRGTWLAGVRE